MTLLLEDLLDVSRVTRNKIRTAARKNELSTGGRGCRRDHPHRSSMRSGTSSYSNCRPSRSCLRDLTRLTAGGRQPAQQRCQVHRRRWQIELVVRREGDEASIGGARQRHRHRAATGCLHIDMSAAHTRARASRGGLGNRAFAGTRPGGVARRAHRGAQRGNGRGSEFTVHLPIVHQAADSAPLRQAQPSLDVGARAGRRVSWLMTTPMPAQTLATMLILSGLDTRLRVRRQGRHAHRRGVATRRRRDRHRHAAIQRLRIVSPHPRTTLGRSNAVDRVHRLGQNEDRQRARVAASTCIS